MGHLKPGLDVCSRAVFLSTYGILRKGTSSYMTRGAKADDRSLSSCPSVLFLFIVHTILIQVHAHCHAGSKLLGQVSKEWFATKLHSDRNVSLSLPRVIGPLAMHLAIR